MAVKNIKGAGTKRKGKNVTKTASESNGVDPEVDSVKSEKKIDEDDKPVVKASAKKKKIEDEDGKPVVKVPAKKKKVEVENDKSPTDSAKLKKKKAKAETTETSAEDARKKTEKTKGVGGKIAKKSSKAEAVDTETANEVTEKDLDKPGMEKPKKKVLKKSVASAPIAKTTKKKVVAKKTTKGTPTVKVGKKTLKSANKEEVLKPKAKSKKFVVGTGIRKKVVEQALDGVRLLEEQRRSNKENTKDIFGDDEEDTIVYLQVGMLKVAQILPGFRHIVRPVKIKIYLPHSVVGSSSNVLLITKDAEDAKDIRSDHTENLYHYQYLLRKCGAARHISEVITLKQLKTEYKEYEAKRHLSNRSDVVLCDDTILFRLPKFLGKHFYGKRKFPIPVNLKSKNLLSEVEQCLRAQILWLPMKGDSGLMKVGRLDQSNEQILENIKAVMEIMQAKFPGGWGNVKVLHLKTEKTKSIPFYINLKSPNSVGRIYPKPINSKHTIYGSLSTSYGSTYAVYPDNNVRFVRKAPPEREPRKKKPKNNKSEINDEMFASVPEGESGVVEEAESPAKKSKTKKKKKKADQETDASVDGPEAVADDEPAEMDDEVIDFDEFEIPDFDEFEEDTKAKKKRKGAGDKGDASDKKAAKGKKKKKKVEEELDLDLDLDEDDGELDRIEREYLKSLSEEQAANQGASKDESEDEYDDWAEDSDQEMEGFDMEM